MMQLCRYYALCFDVGAMSCNFLIIKAELNDDITHKFEPIKQGLLYLYTS